MKKMTLFIITAFLMFTIIPMQAISDNESVKKSKPETSTVESADIEASIARLDEIKNMDFSGLSSQEKKELRNEVRSIKDILNETGDGVYISVGAIIIIVLLLIILF
ncbi:MAG: hypothetical protein ABIJ97_11575 [Bacteroidota bacterium]